MSLSVHKIQLMYSGLYRIVKDLLWAVIVLFLFASCRSMVRSGMKENDKQIPIGFGKEDVTILAVRKSNRYNKWLEKRFSQNYFGKYLIIDQAELKSDKYKDIKIYRYVFDEAESVQSRMATKSSVNQAMFDEFVSFSLTDRETEKVYKTYRINGAPTAVMREYLTVLEKVRKRNAN